MDKNNFILDFFPYEIRNILLKIPESNLKFLNEINIINGQPVLLRIKGKHHFLGKNGLTYDANEATFANKKIIDSVFDTITNSSIYAYSRFVNEGFITLNGGHRVGIIGSFVVSNNTVLSVNYINSLCFRINRNIYANIANVFDEIFNFGNVKNTLIISPPGCGKTTFLRTVSRELAKSNNKTIKKCVVIDERFEIAACTSGKATMDVGFATSVISGCKKHIAIPMIIRSMSPDVILTDEIATADDIESVKYAKSSGCSVVATAHGSNEKNNELIYYNLSNIFDIIIVLSSENGPGTINKIIYGDKICL